MSEGQNIPIEKSDPESYRDESRKPESQAQANDPPTTKDTPAKILVHPQPETSNLKSETTNMETHAHHLHKVPDHGWKHYLFEFFMLFLAITLGFFVENIREHHVETIREKQFMKSLIADLENDTLILREHVAHLKSGIAMMDSMIVLLSNPALLPTNTGLLYYFGRLSPRLITLSINTRTFEQLKNSGGFRLVEDISTSNKIMTYYETLPLIRQLEEIYQREFDNYKMIAAKVFSPTVLKAMEGPNHEIIRATNNPVLSSNDDQLLRELAVFSVYMNGSRRGILSLEESLARSSNELIKYLKEEYHLHG